MLGIQKKQWREKYWYQISNNQASAYISQMKDGLVCDDLMRGVFVNLVNTPCGRVKFGVWHLVLISTTKKDRK